MQIIEVEKEKKHGCELCMYHKRTNELTEKQRKEAIRFLNKQYRLRARGLPHIINNSFCMLGKECPFEEVQHE